MKSNFTLHQWYRPLRLLLILCLLASTAYAQRTITGTVTSEQGDELPGVNVTVKGTTTGTITNAEGAYRLSVSESAGTLIFSYIGFASREVPIGNQSQINVSLAEDVTEMEEVVVSALGFEQDKDQLGSTSSTVKSEDITRSGETGVITGLAGKASGVRIARANGDPGAGANIQIRGANTITGNTQPLVIVDGVPISNSNIYGGGSSRSGGVSQQSRLNDINPNDIESVNILKGASAASLWGSRAANGVIVITTKQGKRGKPKISYTSTYSIDEINRRHPLQDVFGQGRGGNFRANNSRSWGDKIADRAGGADEIDPDGRQFIARDGTEYFPIVNKNSRETFIDENFDAIFGNGYFWQNDLSISGGTDKTTVFLSLSSLNQDGIIKNSYYDRYNLRFNSTTNFNDWISLKTRTGYIYSDANRIQQSSNTRGLYLGFLRNPADFDIRDYIGRSILPDGTVFNNSHRAYRQYLGSFQEPNGDIDRPVYNNPLWTTNEQRSTTTVNRVIFNSEINIDPTSWLNFKVRGGVDYYGDRRVYFFPISSAGDGTNGQLREDFIQENELNFDVIGRGNFNLTEGLSLTSTIGWNINDRRRQAEYFELLGFQVDSRLNTTQLNTSNEATSYDNNNRRFIRSNRFYSVFNFNFNDFLFFNTSHTVEAASSVEGAFYYPSFDAAWAFTQLDALQGNNVLSFGKLRASWGQVGVQPRAHRAQTTAEGSFGYSTYSDRLDIRLFGGGFRVNDDLGNPDLQPEIKTEWELGTDLRFFNDRLSFSATYYQNEIENLLFNVELTPSSGFDTQYGNNGTMTNKGIEADLDYTIYNQRDWNIGVYGNFNRNRNEVTNLSGTESIDLTTQSISSRAIQGEQLGVLFGTRAARNEDGSLALDDNGYPTLAQTQGVIGDPNPDWRGGFGFRAAWKGLSLNVLFEHSQGGDFAERTRFIIRNFGTHADVGNEVTLEQDITNVAGDVYEAGTTVRGNLTDYGGGTVIQDEDWYTSRGGGFGDGVINEFAIADGTWTRLRELSLTYTLRNDWLRDITKLGSIEFTATGRNLILWTDIVGTDPEINQFGVGNGFGIDYFTNPSTRSYLFSIKINY